MTELKAGKGSTQVSARRDVNVNIAPSISVSDVQAIAKTEIALALANYKSDSFEKYIDKSNSMVEKLMSALGDDPEKLKAFSDPDFSFNLLDAGRAVASNEGEYTEELLVEILANRASQGSSNKVKIVTKQAIEAADKLTDDTLNSLTNLWVLLSITRPAVNFEVDLAGYSATYAMAFNALKPTPPYEWSEEAELLGLIQIERGGFGSDEIKPFVEFFSEKFPKYLNAGIPTQKWDEMNAKLIESGHDIRINLIQHPLKEGFVLIDHATKEQFLEAVNVAYEDTATSSIISEMQAINNFETVDGAAKEQLSNRIDQDTSLKATSQWWHQLPPCRQTTVGKSISYLHAKKIITFQGPQNLEEFLNMPRS